MWETSQYDANKTRINVRPKYALDIHLYSGKYMSYFQNNNKKLTQVMTFISIQTKTQLIKRSKAKILKFDCTNELNFFLLFKESK